MRMALGRKFNSVHLLSCVQLFANPWTAACQTFLSIYQFLELAQTHVHRIGDAIQTFHPLSSPSPPAFNLSIRVFSNESVLCLRWPEFWNITISLSNEYSELIFFRINWFDLLAVQGTLKSLLQHYSSKVSLIWCSAFFMVQLSHLYMTTGKTIALTRRTFVGKVTSLLFNMLSRLVITFLPRSKRLLISWLQSLSGDGTQKIVSHHFTSQNRAKPSGS